MDRMTEAVIEYWVCYGGQVVEVYTTPLRPGLFPYKVVRGAGPSFSRSPHFQKKNWTLPVLYTFSAIGQKSIENGYLSKLVTGMAMSQWVIVRVNGPLLVDKKRN